jgi:NitT/TauT family transport system substrate-binding protein
VRWMLALVVACALARPSWGDPVPLSVRLKWLHQAQFAGFYAAADDGLYMKEGLDVTLHAGGLDFPSIQMVASGSDQVGLTAADQFLTARSKGVPVVAIAVLLRKNPMVFFHRKGAVTGGAKGWAGKKVGVKIGGTEELNYRATLRAQGVDAGSLEEVPVKYDLAPFLSGRVDVWPGYAFNEPLLARAKGAEVEMLLAADLGVPIFTDVLFTTEAQLARDRASIVKFLRATLAGWDRVLANPARAADLALARNDKLDRAHQLAGFAAMVPFVKPDDKPVGAMDAAGWEAVQKILVDEGRLSEPVDISKSIDIKLLDEARVR